MTIRVVLDLGGDPVVVALAGNERVLLQDDPVRFPLLSELDRCSSDVLAQSDMDQLLRELGQLAGLSAPMAAHVAEIRRLAEIARGVPGATLLFTPFFV